MIFVNSFFQLFRYISIFGQHFVKKTSEHVCQSILSVYCQWSLSTGFVNRVCVNRVCVNRVCRRSFVNQFLLTEFEFQFCQQILSILFFDIFCQLNLSTEFASSIFLQLNFLNNCCQWSLSMEFANKD